MARIFDHVEEELNYPIDGEDHPYFNELVRIRKLVEEFVPIHLPNFDLNIYVDSATPPDIQRIEIRPNEDEPQRNANLWVNMYVSNCYGNGEVRRGEPLKLQEHVIEEISAPVNDYNKRMVEIYGDLVGEIAELLGGDCPEFHTSFEVFLTAAFAVPKPVQQTRLIIVVGLNLTVKEFDPHDGKLV